MRRCKNILAFILVLVVLANSFGIDVNAQNKKEMSVWNGDVGGSFAGGEGTLTDPYRISNGKELAYFAQTVNNGNSYQGKYLELENDIYMNDVTDFDDWGKEPPANSWDGINGFLGEFNGKNHSIYGIYMNKNKSKMGFFNESKEIAVKNLHLQNIFISGQSYIGGIVGTASFFELENCSVFGVIIGNDCVGGILGESWVRGSGNRSLSNCISNVNVKGNSDVGGMIGRIAIDNTLNYKMILHNNTNNGTISGEKNCGGIAGRVDKGWNNVGIEINKLENSGQIVGELNIGGIFGKFDNSREATVISELANNAEIKGKTNVGGILGELVSLDSSFSISNVYNTGNLSAESNGGGIVGDAALRKPLKIQFSHNYGNVNGKENIASIIGACYPSDETYRAYIEKCYYRDSSSNKISNGLVIETDIKCLTYEEYQDKTNFSNLNFQNFWTMGMIYPVLKWDGEGKDTVLSDTDLVDYWIKDQMNSLKYLIRGDNYLHTQYINENDGSIFGKFELIFGSVYLQGSDGWKNLFSSETTIKETEKVLISFLEEWEDNVDIMSNAKSAKIMAGIYAKAFEIYLAGKEVEDSVLGNLHIFLESSEFEEVVKKGSFQEIQNAIIPYFDGWNKNKVIEYISEFKTSNILSNALGILDVGLQSIDLVKMSWDQVYRYVCLQESDDMYIEMLKYLEENALYVVPIAAKNIRLITEESLEQIDKQIMQNVSKEAVEWIGEVGINKLIDQSTFLSIVKIGFDLGADLSNEFFHTSDTLKLKDAMRISAYIGQALGQWSIDNMNGYLTSTKQGDKNKNADKLEYSIRMLLEVRKLGEEVYQRLCKSMKWERCYNISLTIMDNLSIKEELLFNEKRSENYYAVDICCPVSVSVIDKHGNRILFLEDRKEVSGKKEDIYYRVIYNEFSDDYMKIIQIPEESNYKIEAEGRELGNVIYRYRVVNEEGLTKYYSTDNILIKENTTITMNTENPFEVVVKNISEDGEPIKVELQEKYNSLHIPVEKIESVQKIYELSINEKVQLEYLISPKNATNREGIWVKWTTNNNEVVDVNEDGVVSCLKNGKAVVYATTVDGGHQTSFEINVLKKAPTPEMPSLLTYSDTSIVVKSIEGQEYSIDGGKTWQDSGKFTNLSSGAEYLIVTRVAKTDKQKESEMSPSLRVVTKKIHTEIPFMPELEEKSSSYIQVKSVLGQEYSIDGGETWQDSGLFKNLLPNTEYRVITRIKENDTYISSNISDELKVRTKEKAHVIPDVPQLICKKDTYIEIESIVGQEYSIDNGKTWIDTGIFKNLMPNTEYTIITRVKATNEMDEGEVSDGLKVRTKKSFVEVPSVPILLEKTSNSIFVETVLGQEYSIDGGKIWQDGGKFLNLKADTEYQIITRIKETDICMASSNSEALQVKTQRSARIAQENENVVKGIKNKEVLKSGDQISFEAIGAGNDYEVYVIGDCRYVPSYWSVDNEKHEWIEKPYKGEIVFNKIGKARVRISFRRQQFNGSSWIDEPIFYEKQYEIYVEHPEKAPQNNGNLNVGTSKKEVDKDSIKSCCNKAANTGDNNKKLMYELFLLISISVLYGIKRTYKGRK